MLLLVRLVAGVRSGEDTSLRLVCFAWLTTAEAVMVLVFALFAVVRSNDTPWGRSDAFLGLLGTLVVMGLETR